jgi:hypothetical protein
MIKWIDFPSITPKIFALKFILVGVAVAAVLFHSTNLVYFHHYVVSDDDDDRVRNFYLLLILFDWKILASDMNMPTASFIDVYSTVKNWMIRC